MKMNKEDKIARDKAKEELKMWMANDWDLDSETPEYFLLTKNTSGILGHLFIFLITFWWTLGIGNLLYWLLSKNKKKVMK